MKVLPFKIPKPVDSALIVQEDKGRVFYGQLHQHTEVQISYIVMGNGKLIVSNSVHSYEPGEIYIIGSNTPHLFQSASGKGMSHMITLFVTPDSFGDGVFMIPELEEVKRFFESLSGGLGILSNLKSIGKIMHGLPKTTKLGTFRKFLKLVEKVNTAEVRELTSFVPSQKIISNTEGRRLQMVFDYAVNNFDKQIKLEYVAALIHMTPPAFCRFFRQRTNRTFFDFLTELRIAHACQLLARNDKTSIAQISETSGFHSISNFNRKFKKLKSMSPSKYAQKMGSLVPY